MPAFDGFVTSVVHAGNAWYFAGQFRYVSPYRPVGLAELGMDGSVRSCMGGFDGPVHAVARWQDAVFVGGLFSHFRGSPAKRIAKLNAATCELDTTFNAASTDAFAGGSYFGRDGAVLALAASADALYVGGSFTTYRGASTHAIAMLDPITGDLDTTFSPPDANGFGGTVNALVVVGDAILVGGMFSMYRDVPGAAFGIAKLDAISGALDKTFSPPNSNGFNTAVRQIAVAGNDIYVATDYSNDGRSYRGTPVEAVVKLDFMTGALDTNASFGPFSGWYDTPGHPRSLAVAGNTLFAAGWFESYRGQSTPCLVAMDRTTGALTHSFVACGSSELGGQFWDLTPSVIAVDSEALYVAAAYAPWLPGARGPSTITRYLLATLERDTEFRSDIGHVMFNNKVNALFADGTRLWVGGEFTMYSGHEIHGLVKLDDTTLEPDLSFSPPGPAETNGFAWPESAATLARVGSTLFVSGSFDSYRGTQVSNVIGVDLVTGELVLELPVQEPPGLTVAARNALYVVTDRGTQVRKFDTTGLEDPGFQVTSPEPINMITTRGSALYLCSYDGVAKVDLLTGVHDSAFASSVAAATCLATDDALYVARNASPGATLVAKYDADTGTPDSAFAMFTNNTDGVATETTLSANREALFVGTWTTPEYRHATPTPHYYRLGRADGLNDAAFELVLRRSLSFDYPDGRAKLVPVGDGLIVHGLFVLDTHTNSAYVDANTAASR